MKTYNRVPRVAAIHDLSGYGRCSLAVILPLLSLMGVQVCPVPTAVLSTHTGGYGKVIMRDLTDYIDESLVHYKAADIAYECIYSGFLGSAKQVHSCQSYMESFPDALVVVDPVMGDHGKPYVTITPALQQEMRTLVGRAHLITPNLTEAYMLTGQSYSPSPLSSGELKKLLLHLSELGPGQVVITSVPLMSGEYANIAYDREANTFWKSPYEHISAFYPGTGDMLASVLTGALLTGQSLPIGLAQATDFIELAIKTTYSYQTPTREGVMLERVLHKLGDYRMSDNYHPL